MAITHEIRIYDTAGSRQPLPRRFVQGWEFELVDRGGCGTFRLTLAAELDDQALPALPGAHWRVEWWFNGSPIFRGWVKHVGGGIQDGGGPYRLDGTGLMARCQAFLADCAYAKPQGADIGEIFGWLAGKFLVGSERLGEFAQYIQPDTGFTVKTAEFFGSNVREAFDKMADAGQGQIIWGWTVTPAGSDLLYVRARPTTVSDQNYRFRIGKDVSYYEQPEDLSELVNAIRLVGGSSRAPNLLFNPSWELPAVPPTEDASGNLLANPSFEGSTGWTFNPDVASIRQASNGEPGEYARTGKWLAELDDTGDFVRQTVTLPVGGADQAYRLVIHHAREFANQDQQQIKVHVEELDTANNVLNTLVDDAEEDSAADTYGRIFPSARSYQKWERSLVTTHVDTAKLRIKITRVAQATIIDDVMLFQESAVQEGWTTRSQGGWKARVLWTCEEVTPFHGCYTVKVSVFSGTTPGSDSRNFQVLPTTDRWVQTRQDTNYVLKIRVLTHSALKLKLGLVRLKSGGGTLTVQSSEFTTAGNGTWETFSATLGSGTNGVQVRPFVALRSRGTYFLDAFEMYEEGLENRADHDFLDGEALVYTFRAGESRTDLETDAADHTKVKSTLKPFGAGDVGKVLRITGGTGWTPADYTIDSFDGEYVTLNTHPAPAGTTGGEGTAIISAAITDAAMASIDTYGLREAVVEISEITELQQARDYATGYFNRYAVPLIRGQLQLEPAEQVLRYVGTDAEATPAGMIAVSGARTALPDQWPVRILYSLTKEGQIRCEVDLTNRRPDRNLLLKKALGGGSSGGGGGGFSGGGTNLRPGPGNSGNAPEGGSALTWRVNDADVGARSSLHLKAGSGVTLTPTDDETEDEVEVQISASVPLLVEEGDTSKVASASALDFDSDDFDVTEAPTGEANIALSAGVRRPLVVPYHAASLKLGQVALANPGAGVVEILDTQERVPFDLTHFREARISVAVKGAGAATPAKVRAQYSTDGGSAWNYLDDSTGPSVDINTSGLKTSSWVSLAAAAKADILLRMVHLDGNGIEDPEFGPLLFHFR